MIEIVQEVIRLGEARLAEDDLINQQVEGGDVVYSRAFPNLAEMLNANRPAEQALGAYLESQSDDVILKIRTLMYVGRGDAEDVLDFHLDLTEKHSVDDAMNSITEKLPLPTYLRRGLEVAKKTNVDLDSSWPSGIGRVCVTLPVSDIPTSWYANHSRFKKLKEIKEDPIRDGGRIFGEIADHWPGGSIPVPEHVETFFQLIGERTAGQVILDFIDLDCWDCIDGYRFVQSNCNLELYWNDNRVADARNVRSEIDRSFFPASLYGILIRLQEIRVVRGHGLASFLLCGQTLDHTEIKQQLRAESDEYVLFPDHFFSSRAVRSRKRADPSV